MNGLDFSHSGHSEEKSDQKRGSGLVQLAPQHVAQKQRGVEQVGGREGD